MTSILLWFLCGLAVAIAASEKGGNGLAWYFLGVFLGPLALPLVLLLRPAPAPRRFVDGDC